MNQVQERKPIIARAQKLLARRPVYLDTETTGTHKTAEIVEICLVDHDGGVLLDSLVKPGRQIPRDVIQIHGISNAMVQDAPTWPEIWPRVQATLAGRCVGIYNASFDLRLIKQSHRQSHMAWQAVGATYFCIMKLYAEFYGDWNDYRRSYSWQSLEKAGQQCGLALPNTHRAKADTLLSRAILRHMGGKGIVKSE